MSYRNCCRTSTFKGGSKTSSIPNLPNVNNSNSNSNSNTSNNTAIRPVTVDVQAMSNKGQQQQMLNGHANSLTKLSEFKTSSSSSSLNQQQQQHQNGSFDTSSFVSKKNVPNGSIKNSGDKTQTNGNSSGGGDHNTDDFGLFVSKIETKPDADSARAQFLTNQLNSKLSTEKNTKKKVTDFLKKKTYLKP